MMRDALKITRLSDDKLSHQVWGFSVEWQHGNMQNSIQPRVTCVSYEEATRPTTKHRRWAPAFRLLYGAFYPTHDSHRVQAWLDLTDHGSYAWETGDCRGCSAKVTDKRPPWPADLVDQLVACFHPRITTAEPDPPRQNA